MKIVFQTTQALMTTISVTVNGRRIVLSALGSMLKNFRVVTAGGSNVWIYMTLGNTIQAIESEATPGGFVPITFTTLEDKGEITVTNFRTQTVTQFEKGTGYLIPYLAGAVVKTTPASANIPVDGVANLVFPVTHWFYIAEETYIPLGNASIANVWAFDIKGVN